MLRGGNRLLAVLEGFEYVGPAVTSLQRHPCSCGPAAMEIVFEHNGGDLSLESLESQIMNRPGGTSMRRMKEVAEREGLLTRARRVSLAELPRNPLPSIPLFKRNHYIAVEAHAPAGSLIIIDPSIGRRLVPTSRFLRDCDGEMLDDLEPSPAHSHADTTPACGSATWPARAMVVEVWTAALWGTPESPLSAAPGISIPPFVPFVPET